MEAAIVREPGRLVVETVPDPKAGPYDALCATLYCATCTGTDQHIIHGRMPWPIAYPVILGHESVGLVLETGPKVTSFRPGDLVTKPLAPPDPDGAFDVAWGGFAELGIVRDRAAMEADGVFLPGHGMVSARSDTMCRSSSRWLNDVGLKPRWEYRSRPWSNAWSGVFRSQLFAKADIPLASFPTAGDSNRAESMEEEIQPRRPVRPS